VGEALHQSNRVPELFLLEKLGVDAKDQEKRRPSTLRRKEERSLSQQEEGRDDFF
jgi:hypothetical protein